MNETVFLGSLNRQNAVDCRNDMKRLVSYGSTRGRELLVIRFSRIQVVIGSSVHRRDSRESMVAQVFMCELVVVNRLTIYFVSRVFMCMDYQFQRPSTLNIDRKR